MQLRLQNLEKQGRMSRLLHPAVYDVTNLYKIEICIYANFILLGLLWG